mmetsp:Transcript_990/g.1627  ORF Transcript_990/g.1627 Transcript_990/m.1627 type:complete len:81 (+) Transcript_990:798-1040(+)
MLLPLKKLKHDVLSSGTSSADYESGCNGSHDFNLCSDKYLISFNERFAIVSYHYQQIHKDPKKSCNVRRIPSTLKSQQIS